MNARMNERLVQTKWSQHKQWQHHEARVLDGRYFCRTEVEFGRTDEGAVTKKKQDEKIDELAFCVTSISNTYFVQTYAAPKNRKCRIHTRNTQFRQSLIQSFIYHLHCLPKPKPPHPITPPPTPTPRPTPPAAAPPAPPPWGRRPRGPPVAGPGGTETRVGARRPGRAARRGPVPARAWRRLGGR